MSLVAHKEGCFSLFHLFGVVSGTFQLAMTCSQLFRFLQAMVSQNILTGKFTINQLLQSSVSVIIKRNNFFELQSRASSITKIFRIVSCIENYFL